MKALRLKRVADGRRTFQPVRRHSYLAGEEGRFWRPFHPKDGRRYMLAAEQFERATRPPGRPCGLIGHVGLEVLRELLRLIDYKTGRLDPAITTLMQRCKRSRAAIVRALKSLHLAGFLDWIRRFVPVEEPGAGPQIMQTSNAYRLTLPPLALKLLGLRGRPAPVSADLAHGWAQRRRETEVHAFEDSALGAAFDRLQKLVLERESSRRSESAPNFILGVVDGKMSGVPTASGQH